MSSQPSSIVLLYYYLSVVITDFDLNDQLEKIGHNDFIYFFDSKKQLVDISKDAMTQDNKVGSMKLLWGAVPIVSLTVNMWHSSIQKCKSVYKIFDERPFFR